MIVGDLIDTFGYGSQDTPAYFAYDIGTVSCNVGNVNLLWISSTNQHPVIAQNIYRLKNGRLEQLGGSWVKHGFYALTQNLCSTCNGQGESVLGVGCSDPYDFGLNGQQSSLGPRLGDSCRDGRVRLQPERVARLQRSRQARTPHPRAGRRGQSVAERGCAVLR